MYNLEELKKLVNPTDPYPALRYLGETMSFQDTLQYLENKVKNAKTKEIEMPLPFIHQIFMDLIQNVCDAPYDELKNEIEGQPKLTPKDLDLGDGKDNSGITITQMLDYYGLFNAESVYEKFKGTDEEIRWVMVLYKYFLFKYQPDAVIYCPATLYRKKGATDFFDHFVPIQPELIEDFEFKVK